MIAAVADCFSELEISRKNLPIVFPTRALLRLERTMNVLCH